MVRVHIMKFSPQSVRVVLQLPPFGEDPHSYTRRVNTDQRLDQVLEDIYLPRAQWRRDSRGKSYQLCRHDLKPVARGWLEFIQRSIIPTSNRSEVTAEQTVMIHCIMLGNKVEVHEQLELTLMEIPRLELRDRSQRRMPQRVYFPPPDYWDQLTTSLGKLTSSFDQLSLKHQDHSAFLH
ncbi:hypothetical protein AHAS_Ahas07G0029000 [Arachis hypogaea]